MGGLEVLLGGRLYRLELYLPGESFAHFVQYSANVSQVRDAASRLVAEHPECDRLAVFLGDRHLFTVDAPAAGSDVL